MPIKKPAAGRDAGWLILCAAAGALSTMLLPAFMLLPALWVFVMCRTRPQWLALFSAVMLAAGVWLYGDWLMGASMTALAALPALAIYVMQRRRLGNVYTAAAAAGLSLLALYCAVCLPGILSGEGAFLEIQTLAAELTGGLRAILAAAPGATEELLTFWNGYLEAFENAVADMVVPALAGMSCALALSNLLFFRLFARGRDFGLAPLRPFADWAIPRSMTGGLALFLVAALVLELVGWDYAEGLSGTIHAIVGFPLIVQGLALIDFFIRRGRARAAMIRVPVYIGIGLLFGLLRSALLMLGCFEQLLRLRERLRQAPPPPRWPQI